MPCFIYSFRQKVKFNFHRLLPLFLIPVFFFGSSLPSYAANTEPVDFMWFNNEYTTNESWSGFSQNGFARVHFNRDVNIFIPDQIDSTLYFSVYSRAGVTQTQGTLYVYDNSGNLINTITPDKSFAGVDSGDSYISFSVYSFSGQFLKFDLPSDSATWDVVFSLSREMPSSSGNSDVIQAIQNQTDEILGAGSDNSGTVDNIESGSSDLEDYISDYTEIEQSMHHKFVETQSALNGDFTGFSWGSLSTCLNWCSDYLQQIYLNSGDFKMMIVLPLLLGIALFFIGRGAVILANLNKSDKADNDK